MRRALKTDRRGVVAIMVAIMLLPLLGMIGLAIDYGFKTRAQAELDVAADSATLVASTTAANAFAAGDNNWQSEGQTAGQQFFLAQISDLSYVTLTAGAITVTQSSTASNVFNAQLNVAGTMPTYFAKLFGQSTFQVVGSSGATTTASTYVDIHILMDNSSSMLIGATQTDMSNLASYVQESPYSSWDGYSAEGQSQTCAFGCHFSSTYKTQTGPSGTMSVPQDFYGVALLTGVTLRLNVVTSAVASVIQSMAAKQPTSNPLYQVALYSFNNPTQNNLSGPVDSPTTLYSLGSNFSTAATTAANLQVPMTTDTYEPDTDIANALTYVASKIPTTTGTGSASNHKAFVFLITDGVYDYVDANGNRQMGALSPTSCQALKNKNVQVYVLYTTYIPIMTNSFYQQNIESFAGSSTTATSSTTLYQNLQSCASSPSAFFPASSTADIQTQMQNMLNAALGSPGRFTQ